MTNHTCLSCFKNLDKNRKKFKKSLNPSHPIHTLMTEHEVILNFLEKLKRENLKIQKMKNYKKDKVFETLKNIAKHLIEAEPHHQREEDVLFPEIEKRGIFGPTEVMREEYKILRKAKKELLNITENASEKKFF